MSTTGVIAIGRNEGERLRRCLASVVGRGMTVVYIDSNSTDDSPALARSMGAEVVALDMTRPFSAARARNAGFERLAELAPGVEFVQFVDGDCEIVPAWIEKAVQTLNENPQAAVVCGRRRERHPEASVYNRIADIEWNTPIGPAKSCGGDALFRVSAFQAAGGYDPTVVAGEEPELCQRLREKGWTVLRIDAEMTLHDSAMLRFGQWWKRAVRSGYGAADVYSRFGKAGLFSKHVKSARHWALGWPVMVVLAGLLVTAFRGPGWGIAASLMAALALPVQMLRTARGIRGRATSFSDAMAYGVLTMIGKWANVLGQWQRARDRSAGRHARLIEYKAQPATETRAFHQA